VKHVYRNSLTISAWIKQTIVTSKDIVLYKANQHKPAMIFGTSKLYV